MKKVFNGLKIHNRTVVYSLLALLLGFVISQKWLADKSQQSYLSNFLQNTRIELCDQGIRLPGDDCQFIRVSVDPGNNLSLNELTASVNDISSAFPIFQWGYGNEADAAKYLAIMRSMFNGRIHQYRENYEATKNYAAIIRSIWHKYPKLVAGSACPYCTNHSDTMKLLLTTPPYISSTEMSEIALDPIFMGVMLNQEMLPFELINELLPLHAILSSAGDSGTAVAIGEALIKDGNWSDLQFWIDSGINASSALDNADLAQLPRKIVISAWQQWISNGYDNVVLTEYLLSTGYRPALRWLMWLQSTDYDYLHDYNYKRHQPQFLQMQKRYTSFSELKGNDLAVFYNENWQNIKWDTNSNQWTL